MRIAIFQAGGTIDKDYPRNSGGYAFEIRKPAVKAMLQTFNPAFDWDVRTILRKDSQDLTGDDRRKLIVACEQAHATRIIITHGTDTLLDTARELETIEGKIIVLTGAMRPAKFADSDAAFNIGTAVGALNVLEDDGVYIAMHGRVIRSEDCVRDPHTGQFSDGVVAGR